MTWSNVAKGAAVVALLSSAPTGVGAMPIVGASLAGRVGDGLIQSVAQVLTSEAARPRSPRTAHVNRATAVSRSTAANRTAAVSRITPANRTTAVSRTTPANRTTAVNRSGNANRNVSAQVNVNRNVHVDGDRPGVSGYKPSVVLGGGWARPDWYRWSPGGAIAVGAALGFVTAATATWATPPQPGLCWYYTDPSQQDGFWDACP
ncbi:MAG TPA: hypothetical protein VFE63_03780 [Roseiarcus sp.]|jgi:hypothetical protein|nr:hypothetical protein [Roseiarcus sp.]